LFNRSPFKNAVTPIEHHPLTMSQGKSPRLYQRVRPPSPEAAKAQIIVSPKLPVLACRLVDYSPGGACIEIFPMVPIPERFELLHGNVKKKSRVVWRRGICIGVAF
jgi:hypothetical protein